MTNKKSWTNQELADFKDMIIKKKSQAEDDLEINKKRADEMMNSEHSNALYSSHMADGAPILWTRAPGSVKRLLSGCSSVVEGFL